ncbi:TolC family outer membrane protein [Haliea sp. AH-315-K21]|nr:TolC family outer membrane protein [Haliea sp. AH-315-K21]
MPSSKFTLINPLRKTSLGVFCLFLISSPVQADDLLDIYNLAVAGDPQIRQARAEFNATHTNVAQGFSQLLPEVTLTANTARQAQGPGETTSFQQAYSYANGFNSKGYGLNIRQNLLNFEAWYSYQSIIKSDEAAATNLARSEQELIQRVAGAYFDVLRSEDNLDTFEAELEASARILEQQEERFAVGLVPITDVYDSQAAYDLARVNLLVEQNTLSQRYEALEAITGRNHDDVSSLSEEFPIQPLVPTSIEEWVMTANQNNLDVRAARLTMESKEYEADAAKAAMFPTLDISAGYNWNEAGGFSFSTLAGVAGDSVNENSNITLNLSIPIFAGGLNKARERQAFYNLDASEESLLNTQRTSTQNARNSYRSVENDVLTISARAQAVLSAQSQVDATEAGLEAGTRNIVDVVTAQRLLFQSIRDYANARYTYVINTLNLKQAAGLLSPQDIIDLNEWLVE